MRPGALGTFAAFLALAVFWTWPLAAHFTSRIPHDPGDPILNTWLLWWNAQAVPFTARWWNPPIFHPMEGALALSEHLAGIGVITTPLQRLGATPLMAYNAALILSFALSGFFAFLLVRRLAGPARDEPSTLIAACCAGLAYGFGPYRAGQLAHLQVLTSQWMPLALLGMHAYLDDGKRRWLALFACAWLLQALSNGHYLLFFPVLIALWLAWFVDWKRAYPRGLAVAATWVVASLPLVPVLLKYAEVHRRLGLSRTPEEMTIFSATPASFFHASGLLAVWPSTPSDTTEVFLFPGVTPIALVIAGCAAGLLRWRRPVLRSPFVFYAAAAVIMWAFAFGPALQDSPAPWLRPYTVLTWLPGFNSIRVPARFAMLGTLCLAIAAGLGAARVLPERRPLRIMMAVLIIAGLAADGWMRSMPLAVPPGRVILPDVPDALVLELPANEGATDTAAMYRSMQHGRPIVNGYSGHTPPHYAILAHALRRQDPSVLTELARGRPLLVSVNPSFDHGGHLHRLVEGVPGIQPHGSSSGGAIFVLPPQAAARVAPVGEPWPATIRAAPVDTVNIDLGTPQVVRTIGFALRWHYQDLDRRLTIEGSLDGQHWWTIWEDWTGGPAFVAAVQQPLEVPVRITVPDVSARYIRVRPAARWLRREITVHGPR
jgi:hypothetical protein